MDAASASRRLSRGRLLEIAPDFAELLSEKLDAEIQEALRRHERTGRPLGSERFVERLGRRLDRPLLPGRRGPKPRGGRRRWVFSPPIDLITVCRKPQRRLLQ
ncbi:MAG TPA: hypothetical protein VM492_01240, partial [Sumerlaeia bacterium]|nr:hypothetical protein [Sumerlaeia bacterium]